MKSFFNGLRVLISISIILMQQALIIGIAVLVYNSSGWVYASLVGLLCLPIIWVNIKTWQYIKTYGFIGFITANADTSEIDVKPEDRPFNN